MSDEPRKRRSRGRIGWALLTLLVLYPLSIGPATWVALKWSSLQALDVLEFVYTPVDWACNSSDFTARALGDYIQFWTDNIDRKSP